MMLLNIKRRTAPLAHRATTQHDYGHDNRRHLDPRRLCERTPRAAAEVGNTYAQIAAFLERRRAWLTNGADMKWLNAPRNRRAGESREHAARRHATAKERRAAAAEVGHILARLYPENVKRWS